MMMLTKWKLLRKIINRTELKDEKLGSCPSIGGSVENLQVKSGESGQRVRSRSLLEVCQRKLSRSLDALNILPPSDNQEEFHKLKNESCLQHATTTTTTTTTTRKNNKTKIRRPNGTNKAPEILSRILKKDEKSVSCPSNGGSVDNLEVKSEESDQRARSRSLPAVCQRKLSRSDSALNIIPPSDNLEEFHKSKNESCPRDATTTTSTTTTIKKNNETKIRRPDGMEKVPEILPRFLKKDELLESCQSIGGSIDNSQAKSRKSGQRVRSRSLPAVLHRKLSRSDGALNINSPSDNQEEFNKSKNELFPQNTTKTATSNNTFQKTTITKNNKTNYRRLKKRNQKKRGREGGIFKIVSKDETLEYDSSCLLHYAVRKFDTERVIELLANQQIDVDGAGQNGITALHEASIYGNFVCLKILLSYGAELNSYDCEGFTPLDYAVFGGNFECASFLIEKGANEDRIKDGQIAYQENFLKNRSTRSATFS